MRGARVYAGLLRLLPASFREEMGDAMTDAAAERAADRRGTAVAFWLREYAGLVRVAVTERIAARRVARRPGSRKGVTMIEAILRELRFAARRLRRAPGFAAAAFLTLSLALGAVVSIWAVVKNVVVDPLPYARSDRLVMLEHGLPGVGAERGVNVTEALHVIYRDHARSIESAAMYSSQTLTLTGRGEPESVQGVRTTPGLTRVLRTEPMLGRWFIVDSAALRGPPQVVLSHSLWTTRFGSENGIVGQTIQLNDVSYEVIGVMPRGFAFPDDGTQLWLPVAEPGANARVGGFNYYGIGRLSDGATLVSLQADMDVLIARLPELFPESGFAQRLLDDAKLNAQPVLLKAKTIGAVEDTLWVLLATVGLVLVLACANVANLFLVRSDARQTELAVRRAMGAGRRGVLAQFLTESVVLAGAGGGAGIGIALGVVGWLRATGPEQLPRLAEIGVDGSVLVVALGLSALVALLLGLLPMAQRLPTLASAVQEAGRRSSAGASRLRTRSLLIATQMALATVLLVACGLMGRSFLHLTGVDHGFDADGVLTFSVGLPGARYPDRQDAFLFHDRMLERLGGLPGVESAAAVSCAPLEGWCYGDPLQVDGRPTDGATPPVVAMRRATPGYFETLGIGVQAGRAFGPADRAAQVAVINRALADLYFPGEDPVGRRVAPGPAEFIGSGATIVGVVGNTSTLSVTEQNEVPLIFFPFARPDDEIGIPTHRATYVVRASTPPLGLVPAVREALREFDPALALTDVVTLDRTVADSGARISFALLLLAIAAGTALLLGAIGIYGVLSYVVTRRTGEIGIRLALGAKPADVIRMIVRQGGVPVVAGLVIGLTAALAFAGFMQSILFGVAATDPATFVAVVVVLGVLALAASWLPARRAAALDPVSALRAE